MTDKKIFRERKRFSFMFTNVVRSTEYECSCLDLSNQKTKDGISKYGIYRNFLRFSKNVHSMYTLHNIMLYRRCTSLQKSTRRR